MRPHHALVHSRTRVTPRYALMPLEGFPFSRLPSWPDAQIRVLASPALGAKFVQYQIDLPAGSHGGFDAQDEIETFFYVLSGRGTFDDAARPLDAGAFGLLPPGHAVRFSADQPMSLLILQKRYQPAMGIPLFAPWFGHEKDVLATAWADTEQIQLKLLIPDDLQYDLAMNIFSFTPGYGLPIVETHVMEHGLLFLQGKGVYQLGGEWMEVEKDDYIWMGPYCPQSFYATGNTPARYIYYKDVNREIGM
ncbi:MAG: (S)-ureidoglycine aminohydrolase [Tepidisphaeraceae bacterium]